MISGVFNITGARSDSYPLWQSFPAGAGLTFFPVEQDCFTGGYCLHNRLPLAGHDMFYHDVEASLLVLFSGYIYNKTELAANYGFSTDEHEPRIAARMFLADGPDFVTKLNGDFTIFIGLPAGRRAYLFRDHLGVRPVAWHADNDRLSFSSDIVGLCKTLSGGTSPASEFLLGYFKYVDYSGTPYGGVKKLLPGHYLEYSEDCTRLTRYWNPETISTDNRMIYGEMLSDLKSLLADAVAIRCDRRFNSGAHVSSGLDSGTVAALARREHASQAQFNGYSWSPAAFSPPELKYDERDLVRSLCSKAGIDPVFSGINSREFLARISRLYNNKGYFIEESILDQAAAAGTNLIFSGWGGDEFISTGDRGIETDLLKGLHLRTYFRRNPVRPFRRFAKYFLQYSLLPALGIMERNVARSFDDDARYLKRPFKKSEGHALGNFYFHTSRRQLHLRLLKFYHLQERCESWMVMGYTKGVEYRYPLLDRRIVEYMIKVPSLLLCQTDYFRPLLRILGEDILPDDVRLNRSKRDPVHSAWWDELLKFSGIELLDEAGTWQGNPDLYFVDFDLLNGDISRFRKDPSSVDAKVLFKALVYIKAINQFTVDYHAS